MPKIYDNQEHYLTKGLNETLELSLRSDFCVGYFNLRGWKEVANKVDALSGEIITENETEIHRTCRLLVGMQKMPSEALIEYFSSEEPNILDNAEATKLKKKIAQEFKDQLTIGVPTEQDEIGLRQLSNQLKLKKVAVKLYLKQLHAKLYLAHGSDKRLPVVGFLGSSNLTLSGLKVQGELNVDVLEQDAANKLSNWFDSKWNDRWSVDITNELIEIIDNSWATEKLNSPYHIYLKMAYHLSREARAGINEFKLPKIFQTELLDFQQKAVLIAAHHLNKRGGVLIGDVVGLGKTITATALAKLFEDDFSLETLIICPKNLVNMWDEYARKYQLHAKIISYSFVQTKLLTLGCYRLVIIDESHNLRNDQGSRYSAIKTYLNKNKNESKVILLSATPYNKSYLDLSNQLRLFISDDKDLGITPERYIESIGGQVQFNAKHTETFIRSIKAFEKSNFSDDWSELMRMYLVRRTRGFIKNNYAKTDATNGRKFLTFSDGSVSYFPDRLPKKVLYEFNADDKNDIYANLYAPNVVNIINSLGLPRYGLQQFLNDESKLKPTKEEEIIMQNLSRAGRRLMGFCRTNLFKRLESSGFSFLLSLSRHILRNYVYIYALENNLQIPIGSNISQNLDDYLEDSDTDNEGIDDNHLKLILNEETYLKKAEELYQLFESSKYKKRFSWIRSTFFTDALKKNLVFDSGEIIKILKIAKNWNPDTDKQLNALYNLIVEKHGKEKVLVFTQFADTAKYLTEQLKKRGVQKLECVTGDNDNPSEFAHRFSPFSNKKKGIVNSDKELRVLITTDVLSEGQNLQDAHIVLNYDLPWAIIRLIQRAGRVDRIGQKAEQILCYSFLPEEGIEAIINLRRRLTQRIEENANVVGSDETFFDGDPVNIIDLYNEKSGILDGEDEDSEVDLASYAYQIWKNATDADPKLKKIIPDLPNVVYATKHNEGGLEKEGVIVYTKTSEENDVLAWINSKGEIITQSQLTILKASQCAADTEPKSKLEQHHELVRKGIDFIKKEEKNTGSSLGKPSSVKHRTYMRLDRYIKANENTLFVTDQLKKAIDDILNLPLKEFARDTLNRQIKADIDDEALASVVVSLREEDKLSITNQDEYMSKEPQIICSLGLTNN